MTGHREAIDQIRNYIAGQGIGITRDSAIADEIVKCIYAQEYLTAPPQEATPLELAKRYRKAFSTLKK